ncbi:histidine phosphatase family protein [Micromonospora sp. DR5-3]|uniref:histidine phosphatase family protein n=1 Tax=unclassified Micromonospora TaxID=2617518 RepID=UPI0011D6E74B|nr:MULTISPECIES: histidine phosphatase family protein [unclassified Micromonospora]MCW3819654.1 histidine phosphatase family protein [Micromonospora sp. DR5-3]TYC19857.1 histidine phosphatase family protein [Micromonospora sp. MP36]
MKGTTVVLARHGRTAWHSPNRYAGRSDIPLDEYGAEQAAALGRWAAGQGFTSLVCSSMRRAQDTAAPAATSTGLVPRVDDRLRELDFGIAEGRTLDELRAADPSMVERFVADPATHHFPGGERPADAVQRALAGLAEAVAADPGGRLLVVAHNTLIRLMTCAVLGLPIGEYRRRLPTLDPAGTVTLLFPTGNGPVGLLAFNVPVSAGWERQSATSEQPEHR